MIIALCDVIKLFFRPIKVNFIMRLIVIQKMYYILIKTTLILMCLNLPVKLKAVAIS